MVETILFTLVSLVAVASALGVVISRNPIYSALSLILNLIVVAIIFAMLEAHFLAVVQVIVYAGAIMVLVMFVIMLLNAKEEEREQYSLLRRGGVWVLGASFVGVTWFALEGAFEGFSLQPQGGEGTVENVGRLLFTEYVYPFEIATLLIMVGLVGAVMIGRRHYGKVGGR